MQVKATQVALPAAHSRSPAVDANPRADGALRDALKGNGVTVAAAVELIERSGEARDPTDPLGTLVDEYA